MDEIDDARNHHVRQNIQRKLNATFFGLILEKGYIWHKNRRALPRVKKGGRIRHDSNGSEHKQRIMVNMYENVLIKF